MCISVRGDYDDGIEVSITRQSGFPLVSTFIQYTTTDAYYYVYFNSSVFDTPLTLSLNAVDISSGSQTIYITDLSVYIGSRVHTSLEGSLTLLQGAFEAPTVGANQMSTNVIDVPQPDLPALTAALHRALDPKFRESITGSSNPYGDGAAASRIVSVLRSLPSREELLHKCFADEAA
jgi:hypothetical protein